jgi:hypothetical protein
MSDFNEIVKDILQKNKKDVSCTYIYHYTDGKGLQGIIQNNELWLTERNYMNDILDERFVKTNIKNRFRDISDFKGSILENLLINPIPQYIFSTSTEKDLIHQWTYYSDTDSYCIEFNRKQLIRFLYNCSFENEPFYYGPVLYDTRQVRNIIDDALEDYKDKILKSLNNSISKSNNPNNLIVAKEVYQYFYSLIKQKGHYCEKEYRFLFQSEREPDFKTKKGLFVPYIKIANMLNNSQKDKLPISKIIIGPNNHESIAKESLRLFLKKYHYNTVEIERSELQIR